MPAPDPNTIDDALTACDLLNTSIYRGDQVIALLLVKRAQEKLAADPDAPGWQYVLDRWNASSLSINVYQLAAERQAALTAHSASRSRART